MVKSRLTRPKNTNWPINQLRKHFRAKCFLAFNIILEFKCGHFGKKIESLRPSCQKLDFCPYQEMGVAKNNFPPKS